MEYYFPSTVFVNRIYIELFSATMNIPILFANWNKKGIKLIYEKGMHENSKKDTIEVIITKCLNNLFKTKRTFS